MKSILYSKYYLAVLFFLMYMVFNISWAATGSMLGTIMHELHLTAAQGSFLTTSITLAKIVGAILSSFFLAKFGIKGALTISGLLMGIGVFSCITDSYLPLLTLRFLMGFGSSICLVCKVPLTQGLFSERERPLWNGINANSTMLGTTIALAFNYLVLDNFTWRMSLSLYAGVNLLIGILWIFGKNPKLDKQPKKVANNNEKGSYKAACFNATTWGMILFYVFGNTLLLVSFTYLPLYYQKFLHFAPGSIGFYAPPAINVGIILGTFIGVWFMKKLLSHKQTLFFGTVICLLCSMIGFISVGQWSILFFALMTGCGLGFTYPAMFGLPWTMKNTTVTKTGNVMGIFWCMTYVISSINTWFIGHLIDITGNFTMSIYFMWGLSIIAFIGIWVLPKIHTHKC